MSFDENAYANLYNQFYANDPNANYQPVAPDPQQQGMMDPNQAYGQQYYDPNQQYYAPPQPYYDPNSSYMSAPAMTTGCRTLYVGNLPNDMDESEIRQLLSSFGDIEAIKMVPVKSCAFVRFATDQQAAIVHQTMDQYQVRSKSLKMGWGKDADNLVPGMNPPGRILWIGNVPSEVSHQEIMNVFSKFGEIEVVKLLPERQCAFVNFVNLEDAVRAKDALHLGTPFGPIPVKINFGKQQTPVDQTKRVVSASEAGPMIGTAPEHKVRVGPAANFAGNLPFPPCPVEPPLNDYNMKALIEKTVDFVARTGFSGEQKIRENEAQLQKLAFVSDTHPLNDYYRFRLWVKSYPTLNPFEEYNRHALEAREWKEMLLNPPPTTKEDLISRLKEKLSKGGSTQQLASDLLEQAKGTMAPPEDSEKLNQLLESLSGGKDTIKNAKTWILDNPSCLAELATRILTRISIQSEPEHRLPFVYLVHDLLLSAASKREKKEEMDEFATSFVSKMGQILFHTFRNQSHDNQNIIRDILKSWHEKHIFPANLLARFQMEAGISVIASEEEPSTRPSKSAKMEDDDSHSSRRQSSKSRWE